MAFTGVKVVRGADWFWRMGDGLVNTIGTVYDVGPSSEFAVVVKWDRGPYKKYIVKRDTLDLRVMDNTSMGAIHKDVRCNGCDKETIKGLRYKCTDCTTFNLCTTCYHSRFHYVDHSFVLMTMPTCPGFALPLRLNAEISDLKMEGRKIFRFFPNHLPVLRKLGVPPCGNHALERSGNQTSTEDVVNLPLEAEEDEFLYMFTRSRDNIYLNERSCACEQEVPQEVEESPVEEEEDSCSCNDAYSDGCSNKDQCSWDDVGSWKSECSWMEETECAVCSDLVKDCVTFEPCKHAIVCEFCAFRMKRCLTCGEVVRKRLAADGSVIANKNEARMKELKEQIFNVEEKYACSICSELRSNVLFMCGHSACFRCAQHLTSCHMCRQDITDKMYI